MRSGESEPASAAPGESALEQVGEAAAQAADTVLNAGEALWHAVEHALLFPEPPASRWRRAGVTRRGERLFNAVAGFIVLIFATGWTWSLIDARPAGESGVSMTAGLLASSPTTPFLTEAALEVFMPLRGRSGKLRARIQSQGEAIGGDSLPEGTQLTFSSGASAESTATAVAPRTRGVWDLAIKVGTAIKPITDFRIITLTPMSEKRRGRIGLYYIGTFPTERGVRRKGYVTPDGFIEVTAENQDTQVSEHFRLRDFLTHDQANVWPKYLVLESDLIDKLELVLTELERQGHTVSGVKVLSGFRTPQYNASGGDPSGRAALSRHMYGDAADIFLDNDNNGWMDDLTGDGRGTIADARVMERAVELVERQHPALVGGAGVYIASGGDGPFIHVDTRGFRARWVGSGDN